jgi:hypothetical protein
MKSFRCPDEVLRPGSVPPVRRHSKVCLLLLAFLVVGVGRGICQSAPSTIGGDESITAGGTFSGYHLNYGSRTLLGASAYVDADYNLRFGIEGEARWLNFRQRADVNAATYLIGPRYVFRPMGRARPYAKFLVGGGHFNFPYDYAQGNYFVIAPGGGIDYRINRRIRFRMVDVEYQYWPQFTYGALSSVGISTGIAFHFY